MALHHARSGEVVNILTHSELQAVQSQAIVSTADLEVMRLCMSEGKHVPPHAVVGAITLLCLQGRIEVQAHGAWQTMQVNDHLYLEGQVEHALRALSDAVVLVNIQRRTEP
jgi:quercetin dioxygenase-like cupin family protein